MRSLIGAFPDVRLLLSVHPEQLAGFLVFAFRALPWRDSRAVRRCAQHWASPYPADARCAVVDALMSAWSLLEAEGLLDRCRRAAPSPEEPHAHPRAIRLRA